MSCQVMLFSDKLMFYQLTLRTQVKLRYADIYSILNIVGSLMFLFLFQRHPDIEFVARIHPIITDLIVISSHHHGPINREKVRIYWYIPIVRRFGLLSLFSSLLLSSRDQCQLFLLVAQQRGHCRQILWNGRAKRFRCVCFWSPCHVCW